MKASVFVAVSLDGFLARSDGDVSWLDEYQEDHGFSDFFASVDCLVMGRKSFEKVLSFDVDWPYAGRHVVVLSNTGVEIPAPLADTMEVMAGSPTELTTCLAQRGFQHLYVDGGATIRGFLEEGLIDSIILTRVPLLLGSGISLFSGLREETRLIHVSTRSFRSGLVQSSYRVPPRGAG